MLYYYHDTLFFLICNVQYVYTLETRHGYIEAFISEHFLKQLTYAYLKVTRDILLVWPAEI